MFYCYAFFGSFSHVDHFNTYHSTPQDIVHRLTPPIIHKIIMLAFMRVQEGCNQVSVVRGFIRLIQVHQQRARKVIDRPTLLQHILECVLARIVDPNRMVDQPFEEKDFLEEVGAGGK